jgi:hypothetical protein
MELQSGWCAGVRVAIRPLDARRDLAQRCLAGRMVKAGGMLAAAVNH